MLLLVKVGRLYHTHYAKSSRLLHPACPPCHPELRHPHRDTIGKGVRTDTGISTSLTLPCLPSPALPSVLVLVPSPAKPVNQHTRPNERTNERANERTPIPPRLLFLRRVLLLLPTTKHYCCIPCPSPARPASPSPYSLLAPCTGIPALQRPILLCASLHGSTHHCSTPDQTNHDSAPNETIRDNTPRHATTRGETRRGERPISNHPYNPPVS